MIHYITKIQLQKLLQKGLTFVIVDGGYKQRILDIHNQFEIKISIFFFSKQ